MKNQVQEMVSKQHFMIMNFLKEPNMKNFNWQGGKAHPNLSSNNFSVEFTGLIKFPLSDYYVFYILSDAAVSLEIND